MMASDDDEDLKLAIALSLAEDNNSTWATKQTNSNKIGNSIIDLVSDEDESDSNVQVPAATRTHYVASLSDTAIYAAGKNQSKSSNDNVNVHSLNKDATVTASRTNSAPSDFARLNRRQMEEDRLARLGEKRKRSEDVNHSESNRSPPRKLSKPAIVSVPQPKEDRKLPHDGSKPGLEYPDGIVKRTWAFGSPRTSDDIKIEEVIRKQSLELAVLSAFQIDADWISSKLNLDTKVIWVLQAKTDAEKSNWRSNAPPHYRFCFPSMEGNINCMHSKLQLLSYPSHLRIVVPSANLTAYDWGETGVMENTCFIIDLPRLGEDIEGEQLTDFGKDLMYFMNALGLDKAVVNSIKKFDFSKTERFAFVHSIGGNHSGHELHRTGICGLARRVRTLGLHTDKQIQVDFVASSIGSLQEAFLESLYRAAQGFEWSDSGTQLKRPKSNREGPTQKSIDVASLASRFRIYFPTDKTVRESRGSYPAGGTVCLSKKYYDAPNFPRGLMRDCKSKRTGLLMHNKLMFVSGSSSCWVYLGSANLSESAWGRVVKDRTTKLPRLNLRNWECGVIVVVETSETRASREESAQTVREADWKSFEKTMPIPMMVAGLNEDASLLYGNERPWFFMGRP